MKRWAALLGALLAASVASATAAAVPAAAQAGPPDPVQALKRRFRPERGVHIAEVTRLIFEDKQSLRLRVNGRVQLGLSGRAASDATMQLVIDPPVRKLLESKDGDELRNTGIEDPQETIVVGGHRYTSHTLYAGLLPDGKTWVRAGYRVTDNAASLQTIDVFEPAVLKAMLGRAKAKPVSGGFFYQEMVSYGQPAKSSKNPSAAVLRETLSGDSDRKIAWRLWTDGTGLPIRLMTTEATWWNSRTPATHRTDTRYSEWGSHVVVLAPPADQVADETELSFDPFNLPEPKELLTRPSTS
ncbi:hypothetical protein [Streptosporangium sp. NPDC000396]|uniref:hypothetical protein n=1 Tax=Streptosporangium sp. NPDC000396 TaxID=3366185 RepID=UPI00367443E0